MEQAYVTVLFEDNNGTLLMMTDTQQTMKRTWHIDIKNFALVDQVDQDMLLLNPISTHDNMADAMTKTLSKQLFYCHYDTYTGIIIPEHCKWSNISFRQVRNSEMSEAWWGY